MAPIAFVSSFAGVSLGLNHSQNALCANREALHRSKNGAALSHRHRVKIENVAKQQHDGDGLQRAPQSRRIVGIVGKSHGAKETSIDVDPNSQRGLFGMKANAYWESMGVLPLFFAGFGIVALSIKMLKVKGGEWRSGPSGINKVTIPKTAITTEEEEAELHVFKCGGCGYEMYPARGREFKFFPDSFKCPLCGTPKSEFWDLNDPDDPRNQEPETGDEEDAVDDDPGANGTALANPEEPSQGSDGAETTTKNRAETDGSI